MHPVDRMNVLKRADPAPQMCGSGDGTASHALRSRPDHRVAKVSIHKLNEKLDDDFACRADLNQPASYDFFYLAAETRDRVLEFGAFCHAMEISCRCHRSGFAMHIRCARAAAP